MRSTAGSVPGDAGVFRVVGVLVPAVAADQEAGEHGVVGGCRAEPARKPQVGALRGDDLGEVVEGRVGLIDDVGWPDPDAVAGADVAVVREQLSDTAAGMPGGAAGTSVLRFVAEREPVRLRSSDLDDDAGQACFGDSGDSGEQVGGDGAAGAGGSARPADLVPELGEREAVQVGEPGDVGRRGFVVGGRDRGGQM